MIFKTKNGDTIECTPSEFLELAAAINAAKEEDKSEFDGYCSMIDGCCELCKEHDDNCTTCPNQASNECYYHRCIVCELCKERDDGYVTCPGNSSGNCCYDDDTDECGDLVKEFKKEPNYAEKPAKVAIEDMCPVTGKYCEQCARHKGRCLDCSGCLEYDDCGYKKSLHEEDEEEAEEDDDEEEFIFNDIFIGHPETSEGTKIINDYVYRAFKDNYFYHPDIVVTCADDVPDYKDLYIARDKEGYAVLFKDAEAFVKAMRDNGLNFSYIRVYQDDHDEDMHWRFVDAELTTIAGLTAERLWRIK